MPRSRDRLRPAWFLLAVPVVLAGACALHPTSEDFAALAEELWVNQGALEATADSLTRHAEMAQYQLRWMEGVEDAGSFNLWVVMKTLTERPTVSVQRSAFDDLMIRGELSVVISDRSLRRSIMELYADLDALRYEAEAEYHDLASHYEAVLGPGEWRDLFSVPNGENVYPVDYRKALSDLVADNHQARLRAVVRAQARYAAQLADAHERLQIILTALARAK